MNARQKAFCEAYAETGNAAEAARRAGYSEKSARQQGRRLLTNADILQYVRELQDQAAAVRVASIVQVKAVLSDILNDTGARDFDRIKAGEALLRAAGAFVQKGKEEGQKQEDETGEEWEDVHIYFPDNGRGDSEA